VYDIHWFVSGVDEVQLHSHWELSPPSPRQMEERHHYIHQIVGLKTGMQEEADLSHKTADIWLLCILTK